jgi:hypothetical protein
MDGSTCTWSRNTDDDANVYATCRSLFEFNDGGPKDNNFTHCPYCGKPMEVHHYTDDDAVGVTEPVSASTTPQAEPTSAPSEDERKAFEAAQEAKSALERAINAYQAVGYGSHVTQPLRDALASVDYSIKEMAS